MVEAEDDDGRVLAERAFARDSEDARRRDRHEVHPARRGHLRLRAHVPPGRGVYYELVCGKTGALLQYAHDKRVFPVSPTTLYAQLQVIALGLKGSADRAARARGDGVRAPSSRRTSAASRRTSTSSARTSAGRSRSSARPRSASTGSRGSSSARPSTSRRRAGVAAAAADRGRRGLALEAQQCADALGRAEVVVVPDDLDAAAVRERSVDRDVDAVLALVHRDPVQRALPDRRRRAAARRALPHRSVARPPRRAAPRRARPRAPRACRAQPAVARSPRAASPRQRSSSSASSAASASSSSGEIASSTCAGVACASAAAQPSSAVRVSCASASTNSRPDLLRPDDDDRHAALAHAPVQLLGDVLHVLLGDLVEPALVVRLRPAALVAAAQPALLLGQVGDLDDAAVLEPVDVPTLAVHDRDQRPLTLADEPDERREHQLAVEPDLVVDGRRERERPEEAVRRGANTATPAVPERSKSSANQRRIRSRSALTPFRASCVSSSRRRRAGARRRRAARSPARPRRRRRRRSGRGPGRADRASRSARTPASSRSVSQLTMVAMAPPSPRESGSTPARGMIRPVGFVYYRERRDEEDK